MLCAVCSLQFAGLFMSWWWQLVFDLIWQIAGTFGEINAWAFMDYLIMLYPWYDALADINMHLFACLVISSNIISTWLAGWLASSFLVLNGYGYVFLHWMAWNWPYFLLIIHLWDFINMLDLLWFFFFWSPYTVELTWFNQEWWNKSATIRLNYCMDFEYFSAEKFWWTLWSYDDILYVMTTL